MINSKWKYIRQKKTKHASLNLSAFRYVLLSESLFISPRTMNPSFCQRARPRRLVGQAPCFIWCTAVHCLCNDAETTGRLSAGSPTTSILQNSPSCDWSLDLVGASTSEPHSQELNSKSVTRDISIVGWSPSFEPAPGAAPAGLVASRDSEAPPRKGPF